MCAQTSTFQYVYRQNNQRGTAQNENIIDKEQEDVDQLNNSLNERLSADDHNFVCEDKEQLHHVNRNNFCMHTIQHFSYSYKEVSL